MANARAAVTCCHNIVTETAFLCKALTQQRKKAEKPRTRLVNQSSFLSPTSRELMYATLSRLHTFNMRETEEDTQDLGGRPAKAFYFGDSVRVLERVLALYGPILGALMRRVARTEEHMHRAPSDIVAFANSLSAPATPRERILSAKEIEDLRRSRELKIKPRSVIGIKSRQDWIYTIKIEAVAAELSPLTMEELSPDPHVARELKRDSIYEKVVTLVTAYWILGTECRLLFDKSFVGVNRTEFKYWYTAAVETACTFLPSDSDIVDQVVTGYYAMLEQDKRAAQSHVDRPKENRCGPLGLKVSTSARCLLLSHEGLSSPGKRLRAAPAPLKEKTSRGAKVHTALGTRKAAHVGKTKSGGRPAGVPGVKPLKCLKPL